VNKINSIIQSYNVDNNFSNPKHFLNAPMHNGKTLTYMACQEGKYDIVRDFVLKKKLDFKVKSIVSISIKIISFERITILLKAAFKSHVVGVTQGL